MAKTKKFIKPLYDTTIKYLVKSTNTRYIIYKLIYLATGIDLSDYTLIDQELNTGNNIKDYRLDLLFKKDNTIVNLEVNYEVTKWTRRKQCNYLFRLAGSGYDIVGNYKEGLILMSELEKLKLNDEFNAYYDYEAVIRKEKNWL